MPHTKIAIACQGGGSHTAFTAGVLQHLLAEHVHEKYDLVGLTGTSGGAICATAVWYGLAKAARGWSEPPYKVLIDFWRWHSLLIGEVDSLLVATVSTALTKYLLLGQTR